MKLTNEVSQYWLDAYDEQDENKKVELWKKGANEGDVHCVTSLGEYCIMPDNPNRNLELGIELLKQAAEFGDATACYDLALAYFQRDADNDGDECIKWMCRAAVKCNIPAFTYVETFYADENDLRPFVKTELTPVVNELDNKKELKSEDYCLKGLLYEYGIMYPKDHNKAMENLKKAADMGYSLCEAVVNNEKLLVHKVKTVSKVSEQSAKEKKARDIGNGNSDKNDSYYNKAKEIKNIKDKIDILNNGIKSGEVGCMYELGHIFSKKADNMINQMDSYKYDDYRSDSRVRDFYDSLRENLCTAEKYMKMATNKGDNDSFFEMSRIKFLWGEYKRHIGDDVSALDEFNEIPDWLCKAAENGDERAFLALKDSKNKEFADENLVGNANSILIKQNKTERDYYHLSLYYIYGIVFKRNFNEVKMLCEKGAALNSKGKCAEVLARSCYDLNLQKKGMTNDNYEAKLLEESVEKEVRKNRKSEYPKTFATVFGTLLGSLVFGAIITLVISLFFHKLPFLTWPVLTGVIFLALSLFMEYPVYKIIIVGALFVAVVGGGRYKLMQLATEMTGSERDRAFSWLKNDSDAGLYEKLEICNNGNYKCNTYFDKESGYVFFINNKDSAYKLAYTRADSDIGVDTIMTLVDDENHFAVPLGDYYYVPHSKDEVFVVNKQGKKIKIDIDAESMDIENIAELLKKQHTDSITNRELITLLHSQLFGNDPLCAFFPEQMIAYFKESNDDGMKMLEYNLDTNEKMEITDGINSTTGIIDADASRVMYNEEDRTVYFYDYANSKKITIVSDVEEPRFINFSKTNGDIYIGVNFQDGSTVVYSRNYNTKSTISPSEYYSDTVSFLDVGYLLLYFDGDTVGYRTYNYPS